MATLQPLFNNKSMRFIFVGGKGGVGILYTLKQAHKIRIKLLNAFVAVHSWTNIELSCHEYFCVCVLKERQQVLALLQSSSPNRGRPKRRESLFWVISLHDVCVDMLAFYFTKCCSCFGRHTTENFQIFSCMTSHARIVFCSSSNLCSMHTIGITCMCMPLVSAKALV